MPAISPTEQIVLESGELGWEHYLFKGVPDWKLLQDLPMPVLTEEEQDFLNHQVPTLCSLLQDYKIVYTVHDLPEIVWDYIKTQGFLGIIIPKQYGGLGFSTLAHSTIVLMIATRSVSAAVNVMVPNSLGPAELLLRYGSVEQKNYYLPRLASGKELPCFGLTTIDAGSDAASITDHGQICRGVYEGNDVLGIRLNFSKRYITLAPIATLIGLAFKLFDPDHLIGAKTELGITVCLVPAHLPGVQIGQRHAPMGLAFMNGPLEGHDVFIPLTCVIGGAERLGQGWQMLMESLAAGRGISLPAVSAAEAQLAYRLTGAYSVLRQQFNQSIARFEGVATVLARIAGFTYLMEATRQFTVAQIVIHEKPALASAIAKYHMTELARRVVNDAMDIHAGRGIQLGPRNYLGLGYIAVPICITVEGANILTRNLIIFGQGILRCHPFLWQEMRALDQKNWSDLDHLLVQHLRFFSKNLIKIFGFVLYLDRFFTKPIPKILSRYYRQITRMSLALSVASDVSLLILGGSLKRKENISARLGDVLSYLYLASSVLKLQQVQSSEEDKCHAIWALQYCLYQIQDAFDQFFNNFPKKIVGRILRWIIFPFGRSYRLPDDTLDARLVQTMTQPSAFRDRLTRGCYVGDRLEDAVYCVESAFQRYSEIKPIYDKLRQAVHEKHIPYDLNKIQQALLAKEQGILTEAEQLALCNAEKLRFEALQVDAF